MIVVSDKSRVAAIALTELAQRSGAPVPIQEIAERRDLALHVLEQLFASLRRAGILQSQRGVKGGYSFRRPAVTVTLLEVVEAVDGPLSADPLHADVESVWTQARERLAEMLSEVTVAELAERDARATDAPMFHI